MSFEKDKKVFRNVQRTLTLGFFALATIFVCLGLLWPAQHAWASFTLVPNGVVKQLPTGLSTIDTLSGAVLDYSGNLYVADTSSNEILVIAPNGVTTSVLAITGLGSPGLVSPTGLAIDGSGNLYVADTGNSRIVKISSSRAASVISTSSIALNAPQGVAVDVSGDIFISDTGNSRIIKIPSGGAAAVFTITNLSPVLSNQRGIAVDPSGNLYIADTGNSRAVKVSSAGVAGTPLTTVAGTALNGPSGVAVGNNGMFYVADTNTAENSNPTPGRVVIVDSQGNSSELLTGYPVFNSPRGIAVSPMGALYVIDNGGTANAGRVQLFQSYRINYQDPFVSSVGFGHVQLGNAGTSITIPFDVGMGVTLSSIGVYTSGTPNLDFTIANDSTCVTGSAYGSNTDCTIDVTFSPTAAGLRRGALVVSTSSYSLTVPLYGTADAPVVALTPSVASVVNIGSSTLSSPFQAAVDGAGNTYVTNYGGNTVTKIPAGGGTGTTVSTGSFTLSQPTGVAVDVAGNLFIGDYGNNRIIEVSNTGTASVFAITGLSSSIAEPTALSFDSAGNLYITDYGRGRIVEVNPGGQGTVLATGSVTFVTTAITGSAVDALGDVYIADRTQSRIVKVDPLGNATVLSFSAVGALSSPEGVAADPSGNIYVMDSGNERILRITITGTTTVLPFSGVTIGSFIFGINLDSKGNVLVADWLNNRLVKVNVGQSALTFAPTNEGSTSSDSPKAVVVTNLGDQNLVLSANPTYTTSFPESSTDPNPAPNPGCASSTTLSSGTSCDVAIAFTPQAAGSLSANITITDNTLNVASSTQQIAVSGTGINAGDTTATAIVLNPTSASIGQPITMTATVTDTTTGHTSTVPTGSVTFLDTVGTTVTLASGVATLTGATLNGAGTHTIAVQYSGVSSTFLSSNGSATLSVTKDTGAISGPATQPVQIANGQAGSVAITVAKPYTGSAAPTGSITYSLLDSTSTSVASGTVSLTAGSAGSTATVPIPNSLAPGTYTLTVLYGGDGNYSASASPVTIQITVGKAAPTIALVASANPVLAQTAVTFTATVASTTGTPTGMVGFYDGTTLLGSATLAHGTAAYTTSVLTSGADSIKAIYSGDANFSTATSTAVSETVQDFSLNIASSGSSSATTVPGGTANYMLAFGPSTGTTFPAAVILSVSGLPTGATATLTPQTLPAGSGLTNVTLAVQLPTTAASLVSGKLYAIGLLPMLGVFLLPLGGKMRPAAGTRARASWLVLLVLAGTSLVALAGCGGLKTGYAGSTNYTLTITGTSGMLSHSTTVKLTVQ